jgi:hypothetical protein
MVSRLPNCFFNSTGNETKGSVASTGAGVVRRLAILARGGRIKRAFTQRGLPLVRGTWATIIRPPEA